MNLFKTPRFAAILLLSFAVPNAFGDLISFDLTTPNSALGCCAGPYATVTVDRASDTTATVTFDSLTSGGYLYLLAGAQAVDLNVNAAAFTVNSITGSNSLSGFTPGPYTNDGSGNVSEFGVFNLTIDSFDGFHHSATEIAFTLTNPSATWASASDVLAPNSNGSTAAIHGFACAEPGCSYTSGAFATGFASNGEASVPEPGSLVLLSILGGTLLLLSAFRRRSVARA